MLPKLLPETPIEEAAVLVIGARIEVIREYLPLAVEHPERDLEYVHQLRVATRRAGAALNLFGPCLGEQHGSTLRKSVTRLRRVAGSARDWDVFLLELRRRRTEVGDTELPGIDFLIGYSQGRRAGAQEELVAAARKRGPKELLRLWKEAEADTHAPEPDIELCTVGDLARVHLPSMFGCLEDSVSGELDDYEQLHQIRILGKRLRYVLEVLWGCCKASPKNKLYQEIAEMQEILGRANDSYVAAQRLKNLRSTLKESDPYQWKRVKPGLVTLLKSHELRIAQEQGAFLQWVTGWRQLERSKLVSKLLNP